MSRALSAVALIAAYNEADIIELAVRDLIANGVLVYLIDDGSTDGTAELVQPFVGRGVIGIEPLQASPDAHGSRPFSLERIARRKGQLAAELDADWFINHDADEFRESPWTGVSLLDGIRRVDALGYNAIDFASLDFWPTHDRFQPGTDVREAFPYYSASAPHDRVQVRCWRKAPRVDLASGGHDAQFENRRVFPIRFLSRHYPIRGQAHGERKVFVERRPRFAPQERSRNWHVQYDGLEPGVSFVRDPCELTRYDGDAVRTTLMLRHRGVEALEASLAKAREETSSARDEAASHVGQIAALRGAVDRMNHELVALRDENQQLHGALNAKSAELGQTCAKLEHVHAQLTDRQAAIDGHVRRAAQLQAAIDSRDLQIAEAHGAAEAQRHKIGRLEDDVLQLRQTIDQESASLAAARTDTALRERDLAAQAVELVGVRSALNDARTRLGDVHSSWSWRATAPARLVLRWLRGY